MPKISIIIPVYNVEKYLRQCLDSIVNQTFSDFECICVNDGSTDNSLQILEEYSKKDNRFKIINQENKGAYSTRNTGLKNSCGKYISFVDSDDFVSSDYLESLLNVAIKEDSDIVYCRHKMYFAIDNRYESGPNKEKLNKLFYKYKLSQKDEKIKVILDIIENSRSACMKLYKTSIIKNNSLYFFENVFAEEDFAFNIVYNLFCNYISFLDEELYYYRKQVESLTTNKENMRINALNSFITLTKELNNKDLLNSNKYMKKFAIHEFIYRLGKNNISNKDLLFAIQQHLFYLIQNLKNINTINKIQLNIYIVIVKLLKSNSYILFRILKNF